MLGSLILYLKGMRIMMFQLSGFWYIGLGRGLLFRGLGLRALGLGFKDFWPSVSTVSLAVA